MTAQRHHDSLLARMIPAQSLAAGRVSVPSLAGLGQLPSEVNFDMNADSFRGVEEGVAPPWPTNRDGNTDWRHSDVKDVALPFVDGFYESAVGLIKAGQEP